MLKEEDTDSRREDDDHRRTSRFRRSRAGPVFASVPSGRNQRRRKQTMKRLSVLVSVSVLALAAGPLFAAGKWTRGPRVVQRPSAASASSTAAQKSARVNPPAATAAGYSVQLNIVTRVQGTSFFRTAVDITNNTTTDGVTAGYQYCYTLNGSFRGCTATQTIVLHPLDNFHTDDIVQFLGSVLEPGGSILGVIENPNFTTGS